MSNANGTQPAANPPAKKISVIESVRQSLTQLKGQFQMALPAHINPDRFIRVVQTAITTSPKLLECDRQSLFAACTRAAQDGLLPDGKEAALVPFKNQVQFMPMVGGILKKFRNSGECKSIMAQVVYENDEFNYSVDDTGEHIAHKPLIFGDRGKKIGFYALATTKDGGVYIEVMTISDMDKIRAVSRSGDSGPWRQWEEEMEKKSVIRRLAKRLPMSTDLEEFIRQNDDMLNFDPETQDVSTTTPNRAKSLVNEAMATESGGSIDTTATHVGAAINDDELPI